MNKGYKELKKEERQKKEKGLAKKVCIGLLATGLAIAFAKGMYKINQNAKEYQADPIAYENKRYNQIGGK